MIGLCHFCLSSNVETIVEDRLGYSICRLCKSKKFLKVN